MILSKQKTFEEIMDYLDEERASQIAELVSLDVTAWDQQGCFSPQEIFVELGGEIDPLKFAELLADELQLFLTPM